MNTASTDLHRNVRKDDFPKWTVVDGKAKPGVLYPDFFDRPYKDRSGNNKVRSADVIVEHGLVQPGGGPSLFDRAEIFQGRSWLSFKIPEGTKVPPSIVIRKTHFNEYYNAMHYQIEVINPMTIDGFKGALDHLARNAVVRAIQVAEETR